MAKEGEPITRPCGCVVSFNELGLYLIKACKEHK